MARRGEYCVEDPEVLADRQDYQWRYRQEFPEKAEECRIRSALKRTYGITLEQRDRMIAAQGFACAICAKALGDGRKAHVDHCHTTGRVRGMLCGKCNSGLGMFNDNVDLMMTAATYLTPALTIVATPT